LGQGAAGHTGHLQIGEDDINLHSVLKQVQCLVAGASGFDGIALASEQNPQQIAAELIVIYHENR
jgi:hypothetical protein